MVDLAIAQETAIYLVMFSKGDSNVRIPCLCFGDVQSESVQLVTWDVIQVDSLVPVESVIVSEAMHPVNMSYTGGATRKYRLGEGFSLVLESPKLTDSARYRCEIVLRSNKTLSSTVQLKVQGKIHNLMSNRTLPSNVQRNVQCKNTAICYLKEVCSRLCALKYKSRYTV